MFFSLKAISLCRASRTHGFRWKWQWLQMCLQWNNQQLHLHADGVWKLGPEHMVTKAQRCESTGEKVLLEEHAGGCPNHPQTRLSLPLPLAAAAASILSVVWNSNMVQFFNDSPFILCVGIVHSDLKPANFVIVNASLKLIDFGIANRIQPDVTSIMKDSQVWFVVSAPHRRRTRFFLICNNLTRFC